MERLKERIELANKALISFCEAVMIKEVSTLIRDATIQRFEFSFEASWKAVKQYLFDQEGLDIGSPKGVIRSCKEIGMLSDEEAIQALKMVDDRNLTMHTYNEVLTEEIFTKMPQYYALLEKWIGKIDEELK